MIILGYGEGSLAVNDIAWRDFFELSKFLLGQGEFLPATSHQSNNNKTTAEQQSNNSRATVKQQQNNSQTKKQSNNNKKIFLELFFQGFSFSKVCHQFVFGVLLTYDFTFSCVQRFISVLLRTNYFYLESFHFLVLESFNFLILFIMIYFYLESFHFLILESFHFLVLFTMNYFYLESFNFLILFIMNFFIWNHFIFWFYIERKYRNSFLLAIFPTPTKSPPPPPLNYCKE